MTKSRWPKIGWNLTKKFLQWRTLFFELDRNSWHRQTLTCHQQTLTLPQKNMLVRSASPVALLLYKKKTSGKEVRRTRDVKLRYVGFNFGHVQLLTIFVMVRSYSFGHLDSIKWITLFICLPFTSWKLFFQEMWINLMQSSSTLSTLTMRQKYQVRFFYKLQNTVIDIFFFFFSVFDNFINFFFVDLEAVIQH